MVGTDPYELSDEHAARPGLAWERRAELGPAAGIVRTIRGVLFSPTATFGQMRRHGGWGEPLGFAALVGSVGIWMAQLWDMVGRSMLAGVAGIGLDEVAAANAQEIWLALLAPLLVCAATVFGAAMVHVLLIVFGGAPHPYETTFRVVCYTWSVGVLNFVPICGILIGAVWRIVIQIIGIREAQGVSGERAAVAVLVPVIVACFCLLLVSVAAFGLLGMAASSLQ